MKKTLSLFILLMALLPLFVSAQDNKEDVIYLKNGTIYRGIIIEQIPAVNYTIEIFGGSRIAIAAGEVEKITKEDKIYILRKPKPVFHYRDKGFLIHAEINLGVQFGFGIVAGHKFGQFGMFGIGVGVVRILGVPWNHQSSYCGGAYAPIYLSYSGDILKKKITPFYRIYGGYSFCFKSPDYSDLGISGGTEEINKVQGGPMAGIELGTRFYTKHKVNITLGLDLTFQSAIYWNNTYSAGIGNYIPGVGYTTNTSQSYSSGAVVMYIPTFNFGIGF